MVHTHCRYQILLVGLYCLVLWMGMLACVTLGFCDRYLCRGCFLCICLLPLPTRTRVFEVYCSEPLRESGKGTKSCTVIIAQPAYLLLVAKSCALQCGRLRVCRVICVVVPTFVLRLRVCVMALTFVLWLHSLTLRFYGLALKWGAQDV